MLGGDNSTVSSRILVSDGNSAPVIQNIENRLQGLSTAGVAAGDALASTTQRVAGMAGALTQLGTAGTTTAAMLSDVAKNAVLVTTTSNEAAAALRAVSAGAVEAGAVGGTAMRGMYGSMREV